MKEQKVDLSQFHTNTKNELKSAEARSKHKAGRKPVSEEEKRTEKVSTSLTRSEKQAFLLALDGRGEAKIIRELIKKYIMEQ